MIFFSFERSLTCPICRKEFLRVLLGTCTRRMFFNYDTKDCTECNVRQNANDELAKKIEQSDVRIDELTNELTDKVNENERLKEDHGRVMQQNRADISQLVTKLKQKEEVNQKKDEEIREQVCQLVKKRVECVILRNDHNQLVIQVADKDNEIKRLNDVVSDMRSNIGQNEEVNRHKKMEILDRDNEIEQLRLMNDRLMAQNSDTQADKNNEILRKDEEIRSLSNEIQQLKGEMEQVKGLNVAQQTIYRELEAKYDDLNKKKNVPKKQNKENVESKFMVETKSLIEQGADVSGKVVTRSMMKTVLSDATNRKNLKN